MTSPLFFDNSYAQLPASFYTRQAMQPVADPALIKINPALAEELGVDAKWLNSAAATRVFAGNEQPFGADPLAMVYAGYQFGNWNPRLGDGRAVLLGEIVAANGARFDLQLKGSGPTHYSRGGDGRSPLGPVIREYLVSEAMAALGVPTTRALAAISTGESVFREQSEPGGVLTRVASSHIRFGTFQYFSAQQDQTALKQLADYTLNRHYPDLSESEHPYLNLLEQVIERIAALVAKWQALGFIHGVMNTDNMLICGETIDYGPCAFMDTFKADTVYSAIDQQGRYAYQNQPSIAHWNLMTLAQALLPLFDANPDRAVELAKQKLQEFPARFDHYYQQCCAAKLGMTPSPKSSALFAQLLNLIETHRRDFTQSFVKLADSLGTNTPIIEHEAGHTWHQRWQASALENEPEHQVKSRMLQANPVVIPRNHLIAQAIEEAYQHDRFDHFEALLIATTNPYDRAYANTIFAQPPAAHEVVKRTFCGT